MQLEKQGLNIVIRGNFNPAIFHPAWFASNGLIRTKEADAANIQIVHPSAAVFESEWLQVNISHDRFQVGTAQEAYYETLRDLSIGVLQILSHTPVKLIGLNRSFIYKLPSEEAWHNVGYSLAPKQNWENVLEEPGMIKLTERGKRPDSLNGYVLVSVEPIIDAILEIGVNVNDHYEVIPSVKNQSGTNEAIIIIKEQWTDSMQRALDIAQKITSLGAT